MDKNAFIERIKEIGLCEDSVKMRGLLTDLSEEVGKVYDSLSESTEKIESLNKIVEQNNTDMEDLRKANMELFKKVGSNDEAHKNSDLGLEPEKEKLKYEDLFKQN